MLSIDQANIDILIDIVDLICFVLQFEPSMTVIEVIKHIVAKVPDSMAQKSE